MNGERISQLVTSVASPAIGPESLEPWIERLSEQRLVMLGEASHGTHEFYTWRRELTKQLIANHGFSFVAVEGDWPDCSRVNRFAKGNPEAGESAYDALQALNRWPPR
jgi:erythromycin esterase